MQKICRSNPSDKERNQFLETFRLYIKEYFCNRSVSNILPLLAENFSGIGTALGEIAPDITAAQEIFEKDCSQISLPIEIIDEEIHFQQLDKKTAQIFGQFFLKGKAQNIDFEIPSFRISALLQKNKRKIQIFHLHVSFPVEEPGEPESFPIRRLKSALHESEEKYRLVFENAPIGILRFDENGIVKECNRKFLQIMGTTAEKVIGLEMLKLEDKQAVNAIKSALCGKSGFYDGYYRAVTSGKLVPLKAMISPIFTHDASVAGGLGIYEDISEHKLAENKLHYQFQFEKIIATISSSFVNASPENIDGVIVNALKLTARFFNAERGYVFQINPDEKTARGTYEWEEKGIPGILHKYKSIDLAKLDDMGGFISRLLDHIHIPDITKYPSELESVRHILTAGEVKSVLVLPLVSEKKLIGCFGYDCINTSRSWTYEEITLLKVVGEILSNIFAKKAAEKRLHESEEKYRLLAENASDVIWIADLDELRFTYMSPSTEKLYGMTAEEVAAEPLYGRLTSESRNYFENSVKERVPLIGTIENLRYSDEALQVHKDGSLIPTEVTTNWIKDPGNGHTLIIGVTRDITLRKKAEEQRTLIEMQKLQNQKADSLGRMAGAIAHHFNNQLQVVMGNLELLSHETPLKDRTHKKLHDALKATQKAAELSSLMLSYLGQTTGQNEKLNLNSSIIDILPSICDSLPENIKLQTKLFNKKLLIEGDTNLLQQVIKNVTINSVESIGEAKGKIIISTGVVSAHEIIGHNPLPSGWQPTEENYAVMTIADNGCGIDPVNSGQIFDPFFTTKFTGRGLGLPVSLGFMKSIGGGISFVSNPDEQTSFRFYFKLTTNIKNTVETPIKAFSPGMIKKSVLVVEDEEMVRLITANLLENFNFSVIEARSGEEAIEIFAQQPDKIDLVICDLFMPGMNGWETLEKLKKIRPEVAVIMASGYDHNFVMKGANKNFPDAYLNKPYGSKALQKAILEATERTKTKKD